MVKKGGKYYHILRDFVRNAYAGILTRCFCFMSWNFDYTSIASIKELLSENGLVMSKKFGQNFLVRMDVLSRIASLAGLEAGTRVWEVGPGIGALTSIMLSKCANVTAFEIDRGFCRILSGKAFSDESRFTLIEGDVLKNFKEEYVKSGVPDAVCSNLPYNIGSVFIARMIQERVLPQRMVFTLQRDVVKRICSVPNSELYSSFSVLTSLDYLCHEAFVISRSSFWPSPDVESSVVVMERRKESLVPEAEARVFMVFLRKIFSSRRKTVVNNLKTEGFEAKKVSKALEEIGFSEKARAEELSAGGMLALMRALKG